MEAEKQGVAIPFQNQTAQLANKYINDIPLFCREVLGLEPRPRQVEALEAASEYSRVAVRSPRGYGKTTTAAAIALWAIAVFDDVKVMTTAPSWQQLTNALWPEIHKWATRATWNKVGLSVEIDKQLTGHRLMINKNRVIFAVSSKEGDRIEGTHAKTVVVIVDEAKILQPDIWDSIEGSFVGAERYLFFVISTPGPPIGRFYDICTSKPGYEEWHPIRVTREDAEADVPGYEEMALAREKQFGADNPIFKQQFEAEFASDEEGSLFPIELIELAVQRWHRLSRVPNSERELEAIGMDVGGKGASATVIARLFDDGYVSLLERHKMPDADENNGVLIRALNESKDEHGAFTATAYVDSIGIGASVASQVKGQEYPVVGVNVSNKTKKRDATGMRSFINMRAWLAWRLREKLQDEEIALPPDDELIGELAALKYSITSTGKYKVEDKDSFKKRMGKSPDSADAVILLMHQHTSALIKIKQNYNPFYR